MSRFKSGRDPYWLTSRFAGKTADGTAYPAGTLIFWYPNSRTALVGAKAEQAARDFEAARADEAFTTGEWS
jgi:hypothetical protein